MVLCDIGNTSYHFLDGENEYKKDVLSFDPSTILYKVYYICVNPHLQGILQDLPNWIDISLHIDMSNYYETIGIDRIVACEAIDHGIVIDAGSAITVDVVRYGIYQGGFIYPGVRAMGQTYKNISPVLDYSFNFELDLGKMPKNSQDSISYGYLKLLYSEVMSHKVDIFLTGGDAKELSKVFPDATIDERLLFKGMKNIMKHSKELIC